MSLLIRTPILSEHCPPTPAVTSFSPSHFFRVPVFKYSHVGARAATHDLGGHEHPVHNKR